MAEFRATAEDLAEIIRRQQRAVLKRQMPYPVGALVVAALLTPLFLPAALFAAGMGVAWGVSTYWEIRAVAAAYLWRYAWLQEGVVVEVLEDGIRFSGQRGSSMIRWSKDLAVRALSNCFVIEDEGEDLVVLPKRYLDTTEMLLLQARVAPS